VNLYASIPKRKTQKLTFRSFHNVAFNRVHDEF
jgi:hypothetical protein